MKQRKIPLRTCVVTKEVYPKGELTRIVVDKDKNVSIDTKGKAPGRGAYLKLTKENVSKARKSRAIDRALEVTIPETIYEELERLASE